MSLPLGAGRFPGPGTLGALFLFLASFPSSAAAKSADSLAADGNASYKKEDYSKAYDYYKKAAEKEKNEKFLFNSGDALYKLEQYEEADKNFEKIKDPKISSRALFNLGNSKYIQKKLDEAIENYKKAILLDPKDENAKHNLQIALTQKKDNQCEKPDDKKKDKKEDKQQGGGEGDRKNKNQDDKDKDKGGKDKKDQEKKEQEKKRAEQILNMLKEKEGENQKNMQQQNFDPAGSDQFTDKDW